MSAAEKIIIFSSLSQNLQKFQEIFQEILNLY